MKNLTVTGAPALAADRLGKRYGRRVWALRDCTLQLPEGRVTALVGPNGAGKTTLLQLAIGLLAPTEGTVQVFGTTARANTPAALARVGFVAQDHPLYKGFTVADLLTMGRRLNLPGRWDQALAKQRLAALGIPLRQRAGRLSGAASRPRSRSPWPWRSGHGCCCWTSQSPASTRSPAASSCRR